MFGLTLAGAILRSSSVLCVMMLIGVFAMSLVLTRQAYREWKE